ncbi:MAG: branched-chain amino acid transporter permease [Rhodospirillales bacterium]|nr:branched-chain amino acid transporter permease [Rhodospirillales bacterium]
MLRDAAVAALAAGLLGLPLIGFRLLDQSGGEGLTTRWPELAAAVALVFTGRLALLLIDGGAVRVALLIMVAFAASAFFVPWPAQFLKVVAVGGAAIIAIRAGLILAGPRPVALAGGAIRPIGRFLPWLLVLFALILPVLPFADRGVVDVGILILTYILLGWGLNIVTGLAGLLDLGYVAFLAIGAYTTAILGTQYGLSFWMCLPFSALSASAAGILLGFPVLRLRGDYFAIVTLGFGEIIRIVANNWRSLTNGSQGINNLPRPTFFGLADFTGSPAPGHKAFSTLFGIPYSPIHRVIFLYYVVLALALAVNIFTLRIRRLPIGRAWEALREDEIAAQALGIDRRRIKLAAFAIGAAWGGIAGAVFDARQGFITPESFGFLESAVITAIVVLGGLGSQLGIVLAALVLIGLPELFRGLNDYRMLAFGAAMIAIMLFRPRGLIATRRPTAILK